MHKTAFFLSILLVAASFVCAQNTSTVRTSTGREFWVMFLDNQGDQTPHQTTLTAIGDSNASITVSNPSTGWNTTVNITAGQSVQITVPLTSSISHQSNTSQTKHLGLHVTSSSSINLYAKNYKFKCNDATLIIPSHSLGTQYIMQDYQGDVSHSSISSAEVGFVATQNNTILTVVLPCNLMNNSAAAGDTLTVNLMCGESYQLIATAPGSFSGMEVTSNGKPFAAFQGNRVAYIPTGASGADLLYEQAIPVEYWGTDYVVLPTSGRNGDQIRITSSEDNCQIYANGMLVSTLQKGETFEDNLSGGNAKRYTSTKKICVGRYLRSNSSGGNPGDPSSVMIPDVTQGCEHIRFELLASSDIENYFINIVARNEDTAGITLDGLSISHTFTPIDTAYCFSQIAYSASTHVLESPLGPVVAECYGLGYYASYAYLLGRSFCEQQTGQPTACPNHTTVGDDFWVTFIPNGQTTTPTFSLLATGLDNATITVTNPITGWSTTASHTGGTKTCINLPTVSGNNIPSATAANLGFHVTSTADISLYASNFIDDSWDICNILPTERLTSQYIVQDYPNNSNYQGAMALVATEDNTVFSMVLPCAVDGLSLPVGSTYTVTLNAGQTLALKCGENDGFSGMTVSSNNKPFALFQGHSCARVGTTDALRGRDHLMEQSIPLDWWGREFVVVSEQARTEGDRIRITASGNNTVVNIVGLLGNSTFTLNAGQTHEYHLPANSAAHITSSGPVYVCKYLISFDKFNPTSLGDPASVDIPPVHNWLCSTTFPVHNSNNNPSSEQYISAGHHYIDIVTTTAAVDSMRLDGVLLPSSQFTALTGTPYSYYQGTIALGAHTLENSSGPFYASVSGHGRWVGYAFLAGMGLDEEPHHGECTMDNGQGTDFWATFLCNDDDPANAVLSLIATGAQEASVTVTNPVTGWTQTTTLPAGDKIRITLPTANTIPSGQPHNIGYHITSTEPITLYASNYKEGSLDFSQVLPSFALSDNYLVQNYSNNSDHPANVAIVATEDSTQLTMVLPCTVTGLSLPAGSLYSVTLNRGQSLMLRANQGSDFSGMEIHSNCKPFALFQGCAAGRVGDNGTNTGRDHFFEQALPPALWGTEFVVNASLDRTEGDRVLITAGDDNCIVQINGIIVATLMRGQSHEYSLASNTTAYIVTSQPAYACLYLVSYRNGGTLGDPGAATLPPVNRWVCHSNFMLHQCNNNTSSQFYIANPYINIVADSTTVGVLALDGAVIPASQFSPVAGAPYSHTRMHITYGPHTLDGGNAGTFAARVYGLGQWAGFSYNIDMLFDTIERCIPERHRDTVNHYDTVCQGHGYNGYGFDVTGAQTAVAGNIILTDSTTVDDTLVRYTSLTLTVLPNSTNEVSTSIVVGDTLVYCDSVITLAGDYIFTLTAANGCDSIIMLHITYQTIGLSASANGVCPGEEVTLTAEGTHIYYWGSTPYDPELDSQQGENPITVHPEVTTTYQLLDASGNIISSVTVGVEPPPTLCIETNRDFIDFDHPVVTLHDCSPDRYSSTWVFSDGYTLNGERARRQFVHPLPDTVTVTLRSCNRYGCCADTTIGFRPLIRSVWFPNVFIPDGEQNNRFGAVTSCQVAEFELFVYNRWGLLVYHTTDILALWDGTRDGVPLSQGAYAYRWYLKDVYGDRWSGTGTVTLLR